MSDSQGQKKRRQLGLSAATAAAARGGGVGTLHPELVEDDGMKLGFCFQVCVGGAWRESCARPLEGAFTLCR